MVNFTNLGILGDASYFRRYYQVMTNQEAVGMLKQQQSALQRKRWRGITVEVLTDKVNRSVALVREVVRDCGGKISSLLLL